MTPNNAVPSPGTGAPGIGLQSSYPVELRQISDRLQLLVDVANGNVTVRYTLLTIGSENFSTDFSAVFNNLADGAGAFGEGWIASVGHDVGLEINTSTVILHGPTGSTVTYTKNSDGSYTGSSGANAKLTHNSDGTWSLKFDKSEDVWTFYSDGVLKQQANKHGIAIQDNYDSNDRLAAVYDSLGRVTTVDSYDASNRITQLTDIAGAHYGAFTYDAAGHLASFPDQNGHQVSFGYDQYGNLTSITDPNGDQYTLHYDNVRRVDTINEPQGGTNPAATTHYDYPSAGTTTETDPRGNTTTYSFDSSGRQTKAVDPLGHTQSKTYTANSDVASTTNGLGNTINFGFDARNNPTSATLPTGAKTVVGYTNAGHPTLPTSVTDPQGNQFTGVYNAAGDLVSKHAVQQAFDVFTYTYNNAGQVTKATDGNGHATTYGYDGGGHLTVITPPAPRQLSVYSYDSKDRIVEIDDGNGNHTQYGYDAMDRLVEIGNDNGGTYTPLQYNNFDANGNLASRYFADTGVTFGYNPRNQVTEAHNTRGTTTYNLSYVYDANDNLTDFYDPTSHIHYDYDKANRLIDQNGPNTGMSATYGYDNANNRTTTTFGNNVKVAVTYDKSNRQTALTATTTGGTKLVNRTYKFSNTAGADTSLLQVETREGTTLNYTYDSLDRLTKQGTNTYTLDKASNITAAEGRSSTVNAADEATTVAGTTYGYDGAGNLTSGSGGELTDTYSVTNQLTQSTTRNNGTNTVTYDTADQSQRAVIANTTGTTTTTRTLENTAIGITAVTTNGSSSEFVRDSHGSLVGQVTGSGGNLYAITDYQGSTLALVDANQNKAASYDYTAYGTTGPVGSSALANPFRWIGGYQIDDLHGTYDLGYRQHDPFLTRFTQPDPSGQEANPYAYGLANPAIFFDPSGLLSIGNSCAGSIAGFAASAVGVIGGAFTLETGIGAALLAVGYVGATQSAFSIADSCLGANI